MDDIDILTSSGTVLYLLRNPTVQLMESERRADLPVYQLTYSLSNFEQSKRM